MAKNGNKVSGSAVIPHLLILSLVLLMVGCVSYRTVDSHYEFPEFDGQTALTVHCALHQLLCDVPVNIQYDGSLSRYMGPREGGAIGNHPEECQQLWRLSYADKRWLGEVAFVLRKEEGGFATWKVNGKTITWFDWNEWNGNDVMKTMYNVSIVRSELGGSLSNLISQVESVRWVSSNSNYGVSIQFRDGRQTVPTKKMYGPPRVG